METHGGVANTPNSADEASRHRNRFRESTGPRLGAEPPAPPAAENLRFLDRGGPAYDGVEIPWEWIAARSQAE
jgi:hypothetical protein